MTTYPLLPLNLVVSMNSGAAARFMRDKLNIEPCAFYLSAARQQVRIMFDREYLDSIASLVAENPWTAESVVVYFVLNKVSGLLIWRAIFDQDGRLQGAPDHFDWDDMEVGDVR